MIKEQFLIFYKIAKHGRRTIFLFGIFLCVITSLYTQDLFRSQSINVLYDSLDIASIENNDHKFPHIIKTNPTLYFRGNFNLSYELFVHKRISVEPQAGIVIPSQIWISFFESMLYHIPEEDLARQYYSGYEFRFHAKYFFGNSAPFKSIYVCPLFIYSQTHGDKVWVSYPDTEHSKYNFDYERLESGKASSKTFGVIFGYMLSIDKKWFFEVYIGFGEERIKEYDRYVYDMKPIPVGFEFEPHVLQDWNHPSTRIFAGIKIGYNLR